jgi:hypothetical protein
VEKTERVSEVAPRLHRKLRTAAFLLILGLIVEVGTLQWSNPTSFLFFIGVGGFLVAAGVAVYLLAIVDQ